MKIYILRHGTAEPRGEQVAEEERKLTPEGKKGVKNVLQMARSAGVQPEVILTSPWLRALETASMAAEALKCADVKQTRSLLPAVPPSQIWREILAHAQAKQVMIVGHEPHLSRVAAFLLDSPLPIDLKKGAILRVDVEGEESHPGGVLKWFITPKLAGKKKKEAP